MNLNKQQNLMSPCIISITHKLDKTSLKQNSNHQCVIYRMHDMIQA